MINHLRGTIESVQEGAVVIEVGGVGFFVRVPTSVSGSCEVGQQRLLPTELLMRQDEISIYGFVSGFERELFRLLTSISGVGPKLALKVLGATSPGDLVQAISEEDITFLVKIPGVGSKTAKRIAVELSEKISKLVSDTTAQVGSTGSYREAETVLRSLGCTPDEARQALDQVVLSSGEGTAPTAEKLVMEAMRYLGQGED